MEPDRCPCCYEEGTFTLYPGEYEYCGPQLSPDEGECSACGFQYSQHIDHPMREQVLSYREYSRKAGREILTDEIIACDKADGFKDKQ